MFRTIGKTEKILYAILFVIVIIGLVIALLSEDLFKNIYVIEDGVIEYLTAIILFLTGLQLFYHLIPFRNKFQVGFIITFCLGVFFIFMAGEEVSWGQRIFNIESSSYFIENNTQGEMNLHNLKIYDIPVNRLVFGQVITIGIIAYLLIFPFLFDKSRYFQTLINKFLIPVPANHHILMFTLLTVLILLIPSGKKWELYEFVLSLIFFMIILKPKNAIYSDQLFSINKSKINVVSAQ